MSKLASEPSGEFGRLWAAGTVAGVGTGVTAVAGPLLAAALTSDPVRIAGLMMAEQLPWVVLALPTGALSDRMDRRLLMTASGVIRLAGLAALAAAVAVGQPGLPLLYVIFMLVGCAGVLYDNASMAMLPATVRDGSLSLERANGRMLASRTLGESLAGPPLGGLLFALAAWLPFALDALLFAAVTALSLLLSPVRVAPERPRVSLRAAIADGLRWLLRHRLLRGFAVTVAVSNLMLGAVLSLLVLIAQQRLGLGPVGYGLLLTAAAVGGIAGSLVTARLVALVGTGTVLRAGLVIETLAGPLLAVTTSPALVMIMMGLLGVELLTFSTIGASLRQSLAPADMLGRVHSAYRLLTNAGLLAGAALGGLVARSFGLTAPFWLSPAILGILTVCVWRLFGNAEIEAARRSTTRYR
ncbi:MAG TPA: MFS transporter [Actinophytocola sp.]|uniref:MFS transporter n=1 Tax=Actinophytocola sp. TaxID=1872138 RepID=UPI002DB6119A|nr:MFS transporter [Actinophytocola sp.]HEU5470044.1 MFS transporter [Actinophytocola sp.]